MIDQIKYYAIGILLALAAISGLIAMASCSASGASHEERVRAHMEWRAEVRAQRRGEK